MNRLRLGPKLLRTLSERGGIAVKTIIGSELIAEAMSRIELAPTAANALGRALMGAVLIAASAGKGATEPQAETVQLQFRGDGPLGAVVAISDAGGRVRGTVSEPAVNLVRGDGSPDVARALGLGTLSVVRHRAGWKEPYSGTVPLVSGEMARDLTLYLTESEQIPSAMGLAVAVAGDASAVVAAGFLAQVLPGATTEEVDRLERNVQELPKLSRLVLEGSRCDDLTARLLSGLGSREHYRSEPVFYCPCTRERAGRSLALLGRSELREIMASGESQEVRCQFCARAYDFSPDEMGALLPDC